MSDPRITLFTLPQHALPSSPWMFRTLTTWCEALEPYGVDVDDMEDSLTITFPGENIFLVLFQKECQQFWISSPLSGGRHFFYEATTQQWQDTRTQEELFMFLRDEFQQLLRPMFQGEA